MGRRHQRLDAVAAADLERHHRAELRSQQLFLDLDSARNIATVGEPLLADERRPHIRDHCHPIFVGEVERRHHGHAMSLGIEPPHVEEPQIGAAAAPGAEDPSADCQRLKVLEREFFHRAPDSKDAVWAKERNYVAVYLIWRARDSEAHWPGSLEPPSGPSKPILSPVPPVLSGAHQARSPG